MRSRRFERPAPAAGAAPSDDDEGVTGILPALREGETLEMKQVSPEQKFTQPPARYSEATLVKALEENGIGRPSTYASIIGVLQAREYVDKIDGRFKPTMLGRLLVEQLLSPSFDDILDVEYTAKMEESLDDIEQGRTDYKDDAHELLRQVRGRSVARLARHDQPQGRAEDRRDVRQVRVADGEEGRQVRPVPRLQRLP